MWMVLVPFSQIFEKPTPSVDWKIDVFGRMLQTFVSQHHILTLPLDIIFQDYT